MASPTDMLGDLVSDLRYAARKHAAAPGFTVVALLVLALGIGASTAIFSGVNRVLLKPMPYPDDDRLVMLWARDTRLADGKMPVAPADFRDWREQTRSFTGIAGSSDGVFNLTGTGEPEMLIGYRFEPAMFDVLGVPAQYGRVFRPEDGENVVVLGHDVWDRRFGADPSVIGRKIQLDGVSYTVLGVMPPSFTHPRRSALWVPWSIKPEVAASRDSRFVRIVGRLQPGVTLAQANAELEAV